MMAEAMIDYVSPVLAFSLGAGFLLSGTVKLARGKRLADDLADYGLLPAASLKAASVLLVTFEMAVAFLLLSGLSTPYGSLLAVGGLCIFTASVVVNLLRHRVMDCHCLGELLQEKIGWKLVYRNLVLIAVAAWLVVSSWTMTAVPDGAHLVLLRFHLHHWHNDHSVLRVR